MAPHEGFGWDPLYTGLIIDADTGTRATPPLAPLPLLDAVAADLDLESAAAAEEGIDPPVAPQEDGAPLSEAPAVQVDWPSAAGESVFAGAPAEEVDPAQILRERPDVFAAFYREFYGPNNDRNSPAWVDRVGGETPEHYARYWYNAHGRFEGYAPGADVQGAPLEDGGAAASGRTTLDGIPLSKILSDRPDVFQAFFTEYYGPNNDRNSDAWVQRVGGATVEDYANYWYNAHGKVGGYVPSGLAAPDDPAPDPGAAPDAPGGTDLPPLLAEDPSLDPWNHPALYPDWRPPYPGWRPPSADESAPQAETAFVYSDPEAPMLRIAPGQSLFGDAGV